MAFCVVVDPDMKFDKTIGFGDVDTGFHGPGFFSVTAGLTFPAKINKQK